MFLMCGTIQSLFRSFGKATKDIWDVFYLYIPLACTDYGHYVIFWKPEKEGKLDKK